MAGVVGEGGRETLEWLEGLPSDEDEASLVPNTLRA